MSQNSPPQAMRYDKYSLRPGQWAVFTLEGIGACALVAYAFYRNFLAFAVLAPFGLVYPFWHKKELCRQRKEALKSEFKEGILVLAALMGAGYSMENALDASVRELAAMYGRQGMLVREFAYMAKQIRLNCTAEEVLRDFADRSGVEEIASFAQVFIVAKRSGGDMVAIMNRTAESIRDKIQVHEEIQTMTASRRFEQKIMNLLPFLIILYVDVTSPGFFDQMYTTAAGKMVMTGCLAVYAAAYWISERILDITVS